MLYVSLFDLTSDQKALCLTPPPTKYQTNRVILEFKEMPNTNQQSKFQYFANFF